MHSTENGAAILREAAYAEGYKAGKEAMAKEFFEEIASRGGCSQGIVLNVWDISDLKERFGIK